MKASDLIYTALIEPIGVIVISILKLIFAPVIRLVQLIRCLIK